MSSTLQLRGRDLFKKIISVWESRPDPHEALTLNQIANRALGSGSPQNAGVVGRTLNEFIDYFSPPQGSAQKWRVNWKKIQEDHPSLISARTQRMQITQVSPLEGMKRALDDEIRAVQGEMKEHPIEALGAVELGIAGEGSFLYEAAVDVERLGDDWELPIPEGVGIRLCWQGSFLLDATLLSRKDVPAPHSAVPVPPPQQFLSCPCWPS